MNNSWMKGHLVINLFVYGTLMFEEVSRTLAGPTSTGGRAVLDGYHRFEATTRKSANYPYIVAVSDPTQNSSVEGLLLRDVTPIQLEIFDWFEGEGSWYDRISLEKLRVWDEETKRFEPAEIQFGTYVVGEELSKALQRYAQANPEVQIPKTWCPKVFYESYIHEYFLISVLSSVEDPEFIAKFGGSPDPDYLQSLKHRFSV